MRPAPSIMTTSPEDNNSTAKPSNAPVFDVGTAATSTILPPNPVPPNTVVQLYRTPLNPATGQATGPAVLVNMVTTTAGGVVAIPDINQTNPSLLPTPGPLIPDGTYLYQAVVVSVAGVAQSAGSGSDGDDRRHPAGGACPGLVAHLRHRSAGCTPRLGRYHGQCVARLHRYRRAGRDGRPVRGRQGGRDHDRQWDGHGRGEHQRWHDHRVHDHQRRRRLLESDFADDHDRGAARGRHPVRRQPPW